MSSISISHEITKAPAGNPLVRHPDNIKAASWRRVSVAMLRGGQANRYEDSVYEAEICVEGGTPSTVPGYDLPWGPKPMEERIRDLARVLVHPFSDDNVEGFAARLATIFCVEQGGTYAIWRVKIVEPYTD